MHLVVFPLFTGEVISYSTISISPNGVQVYDEFGNNTNGHNGFIGRIQESVTKGRFLRSYLYLITEARLSLTHSLTH